ncbi:MAG: methyl-accepting chemotaxis protein, partial [Clostridia bacterium]|nr:methyl-accepting chemotaxis protein [Clostridia bacterium]
MKWYLNMKMGKKLVIAFVLVAIIAGIVGIIGYTGIEEVRASQTQIAKDNFPRVESLMLSREEATEVMLGQRGLMIDKMKAQSLRDAQYVYIDEARASLTTEWGIVMGFKQSEEMKALYASANEYLTDFINESDKLDVMAKKKDEMIQGGADYNDIAVMNLDEQTYQQSLLVRENFLKFDDLIAEIIAFNVKLKDDTYDNAELSANQAAMFLIVIIGVAIIVSIALGVLISRMISKPIDEIVGYANNIAQGKLDDKIEVKTKDELGDLQRAFGQILESLNTTMKDINDAAEQVSTGSSQVSDGAQQLSQG